jgi:tRNA threonylcarbamoyladenosine biosynthesis protein TsaE
VPVAELTEAALARWGESFAAELPPRARIALHGELGAGKTTLVRAIARALGCDLPATSPTYALVHEYPSPRGTVTHADLFRIAGPAALPQLGWDEIVNAEGPLLIEWPERAGAALPEGTHHLTLEHVPGRPDLRRLTW